VLGFLSVSTGGGMRDHPTGSFNPVLGFLSVSTVATLASIGALVGFNPVLGFLSVSTSKQVAYGDARVAFQSRAGFSECLDSDREGR